MTDHDALGEGGEKRCVHCGQHKDRHDFPANRHCRDGLSSWCKPCHYASSKRWRDRRRAERLAEAGLKEAA